jgi:tRNA G10  N-methylase Trm11
MVAYARENAAWAGTHFPVNEDNAQLDMADATNYTWPGKFDFVASETYLGRPFTSRPTPELLSQTIADCNLIIKKFLQNLHAQLKPGTRLCLAVPAWQTAPNQFKKLPLVDQISDLGYNQVVLEHAGADQLIYYRADQFVARQLLVITRK